MFNGRHFDRSIILLCVRWYLAYNLSLRDLEEMMAERGMQVNEVSDAERARMRARVQPVWDMFTPDVGADLVKQVEATLKK